MSTSYAPVEKLRFSDLFDGGLAPFNVHERAVEGETGQSCRCLTDGRNVMWVYPDAAGFVSCIDSRGDPWSPGILDAIANVFETDFVSEYEPQFWGYATKEEWDAVSEKMAEKHRDEFYRELIEYLQGGVNHFKPGTIGSIQAEIARKLVAEQPELMLPARKDELLWAVDAAYDQRPTVRGIWEKAMAAAIMAVTQESDLPSA